MNGLISIQRLFWLHALVATGGLAVALALSGEWIGVPIFIAILSLWVIAQARGVGGLGGIFLFMVLLAGALALWIGAPGWLVLLSAVAALGAWDLDHFLRRLNAVERVAFESGLARAHLLRLGLVEVLGFLAGITALTLRMRLPFWWEVLLVILALVGMGRLISYTRSQAER